METHFEFASRASTKPSIVWKYYHELSKFIDPAMGPVAQPRKYQGYGHPTQLHRWCVCNICGDILKFSGNKGRSNGSIQGHLKDKHNIDVVNKKRNNNGNIKDMFGASQYPREKSRLEKIAEQDDKIVSWVTNKNVSLNMVESQSFREMIHSFDNAAKPMTSTRRLKDLISDYDCLI